MKPKNKKYELITEVMHISATLAAQWLASNLGHNRPLNKANLSMLKEQLTSGAWKVNGEAIKFDTDSYLIDGQHRLTACVQTGIAFDSLVIMGVEPETFGTLDTGKGRGIADVLAISKIEGIGGNFTKLAAGIRSAMLIEEGNFILQRKVSNDEALAWFKANSDITLYTNPGPMTRRLLPSYVYIGLRYLLMKKHPVQCHAFFSAFESGVGLLERNPVKILRDKLIMQHSKLAKLLPVDIVILTIKAWNLFLAGRSCAALRYTKGEPFPVIK